MYDIKYAPFADSYIGMAHGDTYEHVKRWLKQRFTFVDTLFDYAPSYNNDVLTIRANTTELMNIEIETYTPVYQHVSWYNGQMDKKKIDGKVSVEFSGTAQAATDQEVLIYGGSNVKSIKGITSMNPNRMLIGSATKLIEIDAHDCPLLADINANKANLSPHEYLNKVDLSNCPLLEGNLRLNNSPLVQEINIKGTNITGMNLPNSIRNLQTLRLPNTMTDLTLNDASMLHTLEFDEGVNLQSVSMTNCNALENVIGLDLLQTPSITLNNSYNTAAELYFRDTTNLSLSNMTNLERVIFTPNNEYDTFELINVANAPDYKVTTFNCPKLSTFMTTAPYRESYNNVKEYIDKEVSVINWSEFNGNVSVLVDTVLRPNTGVAESLSGNIATEFFIHVREGENYTVTSDGEWLGIAGYDENKTYKKTISPGTNIKTYTFVADCSYIKVGSNGGSYITIQGLVGEESTEIVQIKDYGDIQPNTAFTANSIDISNTQFTDVKLLCTTDTNTLKLPTTVKNFYCDSSFDLDTDYLEDGEYDVVHGELVESYTTDYDGEVLLNDKTPNLIPSSADGSLIFSMYAPSNTVTPASGTWDLKGLEFDNFHTFGMNNDVKGIYEVVEARNVAPIYRVNGYRYITGNLYDTEVNSTMCIFSPILLDEDVIKLQVVCNTNLSSMLCWSNGTTDTTQTYRGTWLGYNQYEDITSDKRLILLSVILEESGKTLEYFDLIITNETGVTTVRYYINDIPTLDVTNDEIKNWTNVEYKYIYQEKPTSITMPARYDDYNITIKNADISPKIHNTMLYPLLVNEDNPITGTLDYTNYAGKHLSWSFAYTDEEYVDIIQPKDELLNSYEYRYNAFYDTEYEFDNPYEIARYTSSASGVLPTFNKEFTYTYDEMDNGDGTYTTKVYADSLDNLPTSFSFYTKSALLSVERMNVSRVTSAQGMFYQCSNLTYINSSNWNTSSMTAMNSMFNGCTKLTSLDVSGFDTSNVTNMHGMFSNCSGLSLLDVSGFDTKNVTNMESMFNRCSKLTSLDVSGFDTSNVTNMLGMFSGCSGITSLDVSGFDTIKVTNMNSMFADCKNLTSLDVSGFDTSNVTNMGSMFNGCSKLTSLDLSGFDTSKVTNMRQMFTNCFELSNLNVDNWITDNVNTTYGMFDACKKLTSLDLSKWNVSNVTDSRTMFNSCIALASLGSMQNISTDLDLSTTILDQTSLLDVIDNLLTVTTNPTLTLGSTLLAKLTEEQIAIAINKGWTVV